MPAGSYDHAAQRPLLIAIDGTAGAGKTTIGQMLAARHDLPYLDTGAMYRAITWQALQAGLSLTPPDEAALVGLANHLNFVSRDATPDEAQDGRQYTVLVDGQDVSQPLRSPEVEKWVSVVAAISQLRLELVERMREIARQSPRGIIMIGRDIGSVVLPQAALKVYLDASPEVRARRRSQQEADRSQQEALSNLRQRDQLDSQRQAAPLVVPEGALFISTDDLTQAEVLARIETALTAYFASH